MQCVGVNDKRVGGFDKGTVIASMVARFWLARRILPCFSRWQFL